MNHGELSFLSSRTAEESWPTVRGLFVEEAFVQRRVAKRLSVHEITLWRWLKKNPALASKLKELQKQALAKGVK